MWSYEEETKKVISATEELGVVIAAYSCVRPLFMSIEEYYLTSRWHSPLGRGFLTGTLKSVNDLAGEDYALIISFS